MTTRHVVIAPEVERVLGPAAVREALDPVRLRRVRCASCDVWLTDDEPAEAVLFIAGGTHRLVLTHPRCRRSSVIELPATEQDDLIPGARDGMDATCRTAMRSGAPRALFLVEARAAQLGLVSATDTQDLGTAALLNLGADLLTNLDQDLPTLDGWRAEFSGGTATIAPPGQPPLFSGSFSTEHRWREEVLKSGVVVLIYGTRMGLRDEDLISLFDEAILSGRVVGAILPAAIDQYIEQVGRNDPCPCGSGRKYKQCHGAQ